MSTARHCPNVLLVEDNHVLSTCAAEYPTGCGLAVTPVDAL